MLACLIAWSGHKVDGPFTAPSPTLTRVGDGKAISWLRYRRWTFTKNGAGNLIIADPMVA